MGRKTNRNKIEMDICYHWHWCICHYACFWLKLQNTFWTLMGYKMNEKFSNSFSRYVKGEPKLCIKDTYECHV